MADSVQQIVVWRRFHHGCAQVLPASSHDTCYNTLENWGVFSCPFGYFMIAVARRPLPDATWISVNSIHLWKMHKRIITQCLIVLKRLRLSYGFHQHVCSYTITITTRDPNVHDDQTALAHCASNFKSMNPHSLIIQMGICQKETVDAGRRWAVHIDAM